MVSTRTSSSRDMLVQTSYFIAFSKHGKIREKEDLGNILVHRGYKRRYSATFSWRGLKTHLRGKNVAFIEDFLKTIILPTKNSSLHTLASILCANAECCVCRNYMFSSSSLSSLVSVSLIIFLALLASALIENVAVGAKEMRALGLDVYASRDECCFILVTVQQKIYTCSFAKCWRHRERILLQQSLVFCKKCLCWHTYLFPRRYRLLLRCSYTRI